MSNENVEQGLREQERDKRASTAVVIRRFALALTIGASNAKRKLSEIGS